jgi:hypothetical protein
MGPVFVELNNCEAAKEPSFSSLSTAGKSVIS